MKKSKKNKREDSEGFGLIELDDDKDNAPWEDWEVAQFLKVWLSGGNYIRYAIEKLKKTKEAAESKILKIFRNYRGIELPQLKRILKNKERFPSRNGQKFLKREILMIKTFLKWQKMAKQNGKIRTDELPGTVESLNYLAHILCRSSGEISDLIADKKKEQKLG